MPNKDFYTIVNPTGIFMMINEDDDPVMLCNDCMKASKTKQGHVTNEIDCEHAENTRRQLNDKNTKRRI